MLYDKYGATAQKGSQSICPVCGGKVISKCGDIYVWHWSHTNGNDCDSWSEPETTWHKEWKEKFNPKVREVVVGRHRADVKLASGRVIEFQHSSISVSEVSERETFYGDLVWVVYALPFAEQINFREQSYGYSFRWKRPRRCWLQAKCRVFFDFCEGSTLFQIKKVYPDSSCGGYGQFVQWAQICR